MSEPSDRPAPVMSGRYLRGKLLQRHGMGHVYEAHDLQTSRRVALKIAVREAGKGEDTQIVRLQREAIALMHMRHPNIVRLIDAGPCEEGYCLALEYLDGLSVGELLGRHGPLPCDATVAVMLQVLDALSALHGVGLIHRDVKPENIMMSSNGVRLIDFGLVTMPLRRRPKRITGAGMTVGTLEFMAPEQCLGSEDMDERADIHSCGHVLYLMLTGFFAIPYKNDEEILRRQITHPVARFETVAPRIVIPRKLQQVAYRALEKRPQHRFQTAQEMRLALLDALS